jgi:serine/threonine protein kinase
MARVKIHAVGGEEQGEAGERPLYFATLKSISKKSSIGMGASSMRQYLALALAKGHSEEPLILGVRLGKLLGKGRFGSVFEAQWKGRKVAVKVPPPSFLTPFHTYQ